MSDFSAPGSNEGSEGPGSGEPAPATPPGWYPDPWEPGSQRWWDGSAWTASTARANATPGAQQPGSDWQTPTATSKNGLSEITEWVGVVFKTAIGRAGHVFPIMMLTVLPSAFAVAVFAWFSVRGVQVNNLGCLLFDDQPEVDCVSISGFSSSYALPLVLASLWWLLAIAVFHLAVAHQLHDALDDPKPSWVSSLKVGVRTLPRFLLYAIGALIVIILAYAVSVAVGASAGPVAAAVVGLLWIPLTIFLWIKLSFLTVSAAVAPPRTNLISASSQVSDGRFSSVLGRMFVLVLLSIAVFIGSQAVSFPLGLIVGPGINESLAEEILDEERTPETFAVVDIITNPIALAITAVLINVLTSSVVATIQTAGTAALYRETGGPSRAGPVVEELISGH